MLNSAANVVIPIIASLMSVMSVVLCVEKICWHTDSGSYGNTRMLSLDAVS
jgi:hypothetical protein